MEMYFRCKSCKKVELMKVVWWKYYPHQQIEIKFVCSCGKEQIARFKEEG